MKKAKKTKKNTNQHTDLDAFVESKEFKAFMDDITNLDWNEIIKRDNDTFECGDIEIKLHSLL